MQSNSLRELQFESIGDAITAEPGAGVVDGLRVSSLIEAPLRSGIADDVVRGFASCPRWLPPKYFYDAEGSRLFDAICDTPEYYPTRTEHALLAAAAPAIVGDARPDTLIELGAGAARKTRPLLEAMLRRRASALYVPVDISAPLMVASARQLLADLPRLQVHALVADLDHHLHRLPRGGHRLIAYLGSSIGNFRQVEAIEFFRGLAAGMELHDRVLIGVDLVKNPAILHAAYNDAAGVTAEFNRNVLRVINRELDGDLDPDGFDHRADWVPERRQIEMYLVSRRPQRARLAGVGRTYRFAARERIRTEISRKFTRDDVAAMFSAAGLRLVGWHPSPEDWFALAVGTVSR